VTIKIVVVKSLLNVASVALWLEITTLKQSCRSFNTVDRTFSCVPSFKKRCARKKERNKTVLLYLSVEGDLELYSLAIRALSLCGCILLLCFSFPCDLNCVVEESAQALFLFARFF
jgi:hypothetical protein